MRTLALSCHRLRSLIACLGIAVICLVLSGPARAADPPVKGMGQALVAQVLHEGNLLSRQGVAGVGISADNNRNAVLLVLAERAGVPGIPNQIQGVPVRVMVTGKIVAYKPGNGNGNGNGNGPPGSNGGGSNIDPTDRFDRAVPIGVSIGTDTDAYCFAGTLGCRLRHDDGVTVTYYTLSNNHVYAEENAGSIGDLILQPGTLDNNCIIDTSNEVGVLAAFVPLNFDGVTNNNVDAALATTDTTLVRASTPADGYGTPSSTTVAASIGMAVEKYGRTTGPTNGIVDAVNVTVNVGYSAGVAVFGNQIIIVGSGKGKNAKFSDSGDSGSLIVQEDSNQPVGLLFAGSSGGPVKITVANPIDAVLSELGTAMGGITLEVDNGSFESP